MLLPHHLGSPRKPSHISHLPSSRTWALSPVPGYQLKTTMISPAWPGTLHGSLVSQNVSLLHSVSASWPLTAHRVLAFCSPFSSVRLYSIQLLKRGKKSRMKNTQNRKKTLNTKAASGSQSTFFQCSHFCYFFCNRFSSNFWPSFLLLLLADPGHLIPAYLSWPSLLWFDIRRIESPFQPPYHLFTISILTLGKCANGYSRL